MRPTRRAWRVASLGCVLLAIAILADRLFPLLGVVGLAAWALTCQYTATRVFEATDEHTTVVLTTTRRQVAVDEDFLVTLTVERDSPTPATIDVTASLPVAGQSESDDIDRTVRLDAHEQYAETTFSLSFPVAGEYTLPAPEITLRDERDLVTESFARGDTSTIVVEPRRPQEVHVGQGGDEIAAAFGEHDAGRQGAGLIPAELRQYVPGDSADRIDWKATARLDEPHVREFEAETDRQTVLLVDHRSAMAVGRAGETMLDYAREVALGLVRVAESFGDPLGLYTVGDDGLTSEYQPATGPDQYESVRESLRELSPTASTHLTTGHDHVTRPSEARRLRARLETETTSFAQTLQPFFESTDPYVQQVEGDALFGAVRREQTQLSGTVWTVLITDDSAPNRVRETVNLASQDGNHVMVFLLPQVLFEPGGLTDLDSAYDRYAEFEEFRRELDRIPRVTAFEVGPGDRIEAILAARQRT